MLDLSQLQAVLTALFRCIDPAAEQIEYRVVGTAASLLHGVDLPAGDFDVLLKDRAGVDTFSTSLSPYKCLTPPLYLEGSKQYFSSFEINGIKVEFSTVEGKTKSDTYECIGPGPWAHYTLVSCGGHQVPIVAIELRLITELTRRRADRYIPIIHFMQAHGYNKKLLTQGLKERAFVESEQIDPLGKLLERT
jgi:hypothetical protein